MSHLTLGSRGERAAADAYLRSGFRVLDRNYRCPAGEIDLIVRKGNLVVFCEVKTRSTDAFGLPASAVAPRKQARLRRAAGTWLSQHSPGAVDVRFDVASVIVRGARLEVDLMPGAF